MEKNKITTEICINYIVEYFTKKQNLESDEYLKVKNWKRISKKGTDKIIREFENRKNGKVVKIISTEFEIIDIKEEEKVNLKEKLRNIILEAAKEYKDSDFHYSFLGEDNVRNWPKDMEEEYLESADYYAEPQDLENFEYVELTDEYLLIDCGGDWQEPMEIKIECDENGLYCSEFTRNTTMVGEERKTNSLQFLNQLFGDDAEKILESARNSSKTNEASTNFKEKLKSVILEHIKVNEDFDFYFLGEDSVRNWPDSKGEDGEPQDLENCECVKLTDTYMIVDCGGDWQDSMEIKIQCDEAGLYCSETKENLEYREGLSYSSFLEKLFGDEAKTLFPDEFETENNIRQLNPIKEDNNINFEKAHLTKTRNRNSLPILNKLKELVFRYIDENGEFDFGFLDDVINESDKFGGFKKTYCFELTEKCIKIKFKNNNAVLLFVKLDESGFYVDEIIPETSKTSLASFEFLNQLFDGKAKQLFGDVVDEDEKPSKAGTPETKKKSLKRTPAEQQPFESYMTPYTCLPNDLVVQRIDEKMFPFKNNDFFAYNPSKLGAEEFHRCVEKLLSRNDNTLPRDPRETVFTMVELLNIEQPHAEELQELAIKLVREMYNVPDSVILEALLKLQQAEEECENCECEPEEDNIPDERKEQLQQEIEKRKILNTLVHGCAVYQWVSAFHLVREELNEINPVLLEKYNKLSVLVNYWNWKIYMEEMFSTGQMPVLQGINKVDVKKKEIKASAMNFPVLIHELSKGVMDYLISVGIPTTVEGEDVNEEELRYIYKEADKYSEEQWHYFFGPTLWKYLLKTSGVGSQDLPSIISKMAKMNYLELADFCIDVVFYSDGAGKEKMEKIKKEE